MRAHYGVMIENQNIIHTPRRISTSLPATSYQRLHPNARASLYLTPVKSSATPLSHTIYTRKIIRRHSSGQVKCYLPFLITSKPTLITGPKRSMSNWFLRTNNDIVKLQQFTELEKKWLFKFKVIEGEKKCHKDHITCIIIIRPLYSS